VVDMILQYQAAIAADFFIVIEKSQKSVFCYMVKTRFWEEPRDIASSTIELCRSIPYSGNWYAFEKVATGLCYLNHLVYPHRFVRVIRVDRKIMIDKFYEHDCTKRHHQQPW